MLCLRLLVEEGLEGCLGLEEREETGQQMMVTLSKDRKGTESGGGNYNEWPFPSLVSKASLDFWQLVQEWRKASYPISQKSTIFQQTWSFCSIYSHIIVRIRFFPRFRVLLLSFEFSLSDSNDSARRTTSRVARRLALLMPTFSQIVRAGMHNNGTAKDTFRSDQLDLRVFDRPFAVALAVCLEVSKVTNMSNGIGGCTMLLGKWIDC